MYWTLKRPGPVRSSGVPPRGQRQGRVTSTMGLFEDEVKGPDVESLHTPKLFRYPRVFRRTITPQIVRPPPNPSSTLSKGIHLTTPTTPRTFTFPGSTGLDSPPLTGPSVPLPCLPVWRTPDSGLSSEPRVYAKNETRRPRSCHRDVSSVETTLVTKDREFSWVLNQEDTGLRDEDGRGQGVGSGRQGPDLRRTPSRTPEPKGVSIVHIHIGPVGCPTELVLWVGPEGQSSYGRGRSR